LKIKARNLYDSFITECDEDYESLFANTAKEVYRIRKRSIMQALERLSINSNYSILSLGVDLKGIDYQYNRENKQIFTKGNMIYYSKSDVSVLLRNSHASALYIMREKDIPRYKFLESSVGDELSEKIDWSLVPNTEKYPLYWYSRIDSNNYILSIKHIIEYYLPNDLKYVILKMVSDIDDSNALNKIQPIAKLLPIQQKNDESTR